MDTTATVNQRIWQAYVVVGLVSLLPKAMLVGRELIIAKHFSTGTEVDAYVMALLVPTLVVQVVVSAFSLSLMPVYVRQREREGAAEAGRLAARAMSFGLAVLAVIVVALYLGRPFLIPVLVASFPVAKQALTGGYLGWLIPLLLLQGATSMWSSLITAEQRFVGVGLLPAITPSLTVCVLLTPLVDGGMQMVVYATLAGATTEAVLAGLLAHRTGLPLPHWGAIDADLGQVLRRSAPMVGGMVLMNSNLVIDQVCASLVGSGSVAMLNYGNKVSAMLVALVAMPVGVAVMPYFTSLVARAEWPPLLHSLKFWSLIILGVSVPGTILLMALSPLVVSLLFPGFPPDTQMVVSAIQQGYLAQMPFYLLGILGSQMITALGMVRAVFLIAISNFLLNLTLDLLLMDLIGLAGIALSTSIVQLNSARSNETPRFDA